MSGIVQNKDILVIDDKPENLKLLDNVLASSGHKTRLATNGALGLRAAKRRTPDLILLDINMPEMNGFEVCKSLKSNQELKDIPVIFISALGETNDIVTALTCGGVDYITKPFEIEEVEARVQTHLQLRDLQIENERYANELEELVAERTKQLVEANDRIRAIESLKSEFLTMISHEIRTPLNGILGSADLLIAESDDHDLIDIFYRSKDRMQRLVEQAEAIGRLELAEPKLELTNFKGIWDEAIAIFDKPTKYDCSNHPPHNIRLRCDPNAIGFAISVAMEMAYTLNKHTKIHLRFESDNKNLRIKIPLTSEKLSPKSCTEIFEWTTKARQQNHLETLGLAPVVSAKALQASFGSIEITTDPDFEIVITHPLQR